MNPILAFIIGMALAFLPCGIMNFAIIYENDKSNKKWVQNLKTVDLKFFRFFFIFCKHVECKWRLPYEHEERIMSLESLVYALISYSIQIAMIACITFGLHFGITRLTAIGALLWFFQYPYIFAFVIYDGFKHDKERKQEKKEKQKRD